MSNVWDSFHGALCKDDIEILLKYAEGKKFAVDLGTYCGKSAVILSTKVDKVVTIDIFEKTGAIMSEEGREWYKKCFDIHQHYYTDMKEALESFGNIKVISNLTHVEPISNDYTGVDFVFVDADHTYDSVFSDFTEWNKVLSVNGLMVFHDYGNKDWPDVEIFVDTYMSIQPNYQFLELGGSTSVWRKLC